MTATRFILCGSLIALAAVISGCNDNAGDPALSDQDPNRGLIGSVSTPKVFRFDNAKTAMDGWSTQTPHAWTADGGSVVGKNAYNSTLWLDTPIPMSVRVEFDVQTAKDGAVRVEIFGDGENHESGYLLVFNAWSGVAHLIARLDEHEINRALIMPKVPLDPSKTYRMAIVRTDAALRWFVDGTLLLEYRDPAPLIGEGHNRFGLSNWARSVRYDNVQVFDLGTKVIP